MDETLQVILVFGSIFLVLAVGYIVLKKKRDSSSWEGEIVDKNGGTSGIPMGGGTVVSTQYSIKAKTTQGKTVTMSVSQGVYEQFKIGDKILKKPGEHNPTKL